MLRWFDLTRWPKQVLGSLRGRASAPEVQPELYQHRVQQILEQSRTLPSAPSALPGSAEARPRFTQPRFLQQMSGASKLANASAAAAMTRAIAVSDRDGEESDEWISFAVGMLAGVACGWATLFVAMASLPPVPPVTGEATHVAAAAPVGEPAAELDNERKIALATASALMPAYSAGDHQDNSRVHDGGTRVASDQARAYEKPSSRPFGVSSPVLLPEMPPLTGAGVVSVQTKQIQTAAVSTKTSFDFAGTGYMSRLGAGRVTARDHFAKSNPSWLGAPPVPARSPRTVTKKGRAAWARARERWIAKRRKAQRKSVASRQKRSSKPKVIRLSKRTTQTVAKPAKTAKQATATRSSLGAYVDKDKDEQSNWARRILMLNSAGTQ